MKKALLTLLFLVFAGCGYKPSSYYIRDSFGDKIFVSVSMLRSDPENTVIIKDSIYEALITKLKAKIVPKEEATLIIAAFVEAVSFVPLQYDANGYVTLYRANVAILTDIKSKEIKKRVKTVGSYDFSIEPSSTISDAKRFDAIRKSSEKAIDALISQISIVGAKSETGADSRKGN